MGDPVSVARSAVFLVKCCTEIYLFLDKVRNGDPTVIAVRKEIRGLQTAIETVSRCIADSSLMTAVVVHYWENVQVVLCECSETLESLHRLIGGPNSDRQGVLNRSWKQVKIQIKSAEVSALQTQMAYNRQTLTLSLQFIIL